MAAIGFVISQSLVVAFRLHSAFTAVEILSDELREKNVELKQAFDDLAETTHLEAELEEQRRREEHARLDAERASLEKLRYQLNPHFLFNSLASIRGAIRQDVVVAREMVTYLAEFCRLTLTRGARDVLTLGEEVEMLMLYLKIEEARFGGDLTVVIDLPPSLEGYRVPSFLLQPVVENAIKYGRRTSQGPVEVGLAIEAGESGAIQIKISNTGSWVDETEPSELPSTRVGLANLRQRLATQYARGARLDTRADAGWVHVEISIPWSIPGE